MLPTKSTIVGDEAVGGRRAAAEEKKANQFLNRSHLLPCTCQSIRKTESKCWRGHRDNPRGGLQDEDIPRLVGGVRKYEPRTLMECYHHDSGPIQKTKGSSRYS